MPEWLIEVLKTGGPTVVASVASIYFFTEFFKSWQKAENEDRAAQREADAEDRAERRKIEAEERAEDIRLRLAMFENCHTKHKTQSDEDAARYQASVQNMLARQERSEARYETALARMEACIDRNTEQIGRCADAHNRVMRRMGED